MNDDRIQIRISALADGELDAEAARTLESLLAQDPALGREMALYRKLDAAAASIPVPQIEQKLGMDSVRDVHSAEGQRLAGRVASLRVPDISSERFTQVWKKIAARTVAPPQADLDAMRLSALHDGKADGDGNSARPDNPRELKIYTRLDETARSLPVPELSALAAREAWHNIAEQTVNLAPKDRRDFEKLDAAAATLPAPSVDARLEQLWESIAERAYAPDSVALGGKRTALPAEAVPAVSAEKWNAVWQNIQKKSQPAQQPAVAVPAASAPAAKRTTATPVEFQKNRGMRRRWPIVFSAAAALAVSALLFIFTSGDDGPTQSAMQVPEVLDERYNVQVKYLEGQEEPVVCFFLKENDKLSENDLQSFQWLPD